jgi:hypothetical protein
MFIKLAVKDTVLKWKSTQTPKSKDTTLVLN